MYGIFARPKDSFQLDPSKGVKAEWLADDIAAVTYLNVDGILQQFVATYGDRGGGISYYYVGAEIFGVWEGKGIEVISNTDGISVTYNGQTETFDWKNIEQFGTLAVVLTRGHEAVWTIGLNENFKVQSNPTVPQPGEIILSKVSIDMQDSVILNYKKMSK
ncbi:hypothetical protein A8F94_01190 [Bacillus sp. FJAT-27225]|nr:hypothetical protein A8F94_01190 [Bacillus sp. FJAT-27225]